jgi:hypothetical protein
MSSPTRPSLVAGRWIPPPARYWILDPGCWIRRPAGASEQPVASRPPSPSRRRAAPARREHLDRCDRSRLRRAVSPMRSPRVPPETMLGPDGPSQCDDGGPNIVKDGTPQKARGRHARPTSRHQPATRFDCVTPDAIFAIPHGRWSRAPDSAGHALADERHLRYQGRDRRGALNLPPPIDVILSERRPERSERVEGSPQLSGVATRSERRSYVWGSFGSSLAWRLAPRSG